MRELSSSAATRWITFLGRLLCLKLEAQLEEKITSLSPEELAIEIRRSYLEWIAALTELSPVVLALENVHHADAITCLLAEELVSLTDTTPLCVTATMEAKPSSEGWLLRLRLLTGYSHRTTELAVAPLTDDAATQLVDILTPAGTLEPGLRTEIVERAEGNPFFLKEILRAVLEGGGAARESTWTVSAELPPALESLLMARIDRLPPEARRVAQIAAIIGRDFSLGLLQKSAGVADLRQEVATLLRAEIVRELRRYPTLEYTFTSSLLREAVLSTMTPARLKAIYGRIGALLEEGSEALPEENPGLLAFYYYRSDQQKKALYYLELAATRAEQLDANTHASGLWKRALKAARRVGDGDSARRIEATLLRENDGRGMSREPDEIEVDWMRELAVHYEQLRRAYPTDNLCIVFDIDGTILDMRHLVVNALLSYDREHQTELFQGLRPEDISVHESRIDRFLSSMAITDAVKQDVLDWYAGTFLELRSHPDGQPALLRRFVGDPMVPTATCDQRCAQHGPSRGASRADASISQRSSAAPPCVLRE